jgi:hypothetical protein
VRRAQNDEELERVVGELQARDARDTAREAHAAEAKRRRDESAAQTVNALREADSELERRQRMVAPAPAMAGENSFSWTEDTSPEDTSPRSEPESSGAHQAAQAVSKLLEQRRARAAASATRIAQLAQHRR